MSAYLVSTVLLVTTAAPPVVIEPQVPWAGAETCVSAVSPDGERLFVPGNKRVFVWDMASRQLLRVFDAPVGIESAEWLDGDRVAARHVGGGGVIDLRTGQWQRSTSALPMPPARPDVPWPEDAASWTLTPDGRSIILGTNLGLERWRLKPWGPEWRELNRTPCGMAVSLDGATVVAVVQGRGVFAWNAEDGTRLGGFRSAALHPARISLSPDDHWLLVSFLDEPGVVLLNLRDGRYPAVPVDGHVLEWTPDATGFVAMTAESESSKILSWWKLTPDGIVSDGVRAHVELVRATAMAPDGSRIAVVDRNDITIIDRTGRKPISLAHRGDHPSLFKEPRQAAFSEDGKTLFTATHSEVTAWKLDPPKVIWRKKVSYEHIHVVDGRGLTVNGGRVWLDPKTGEVVETLPKDGTDPGDGRPYVDVRGPRTPRYRPPSVRLPINPSPGRTPSLSRMPEMTQPVLYNPGVGEFVLPLANGSVGPVARSADSRFVLIAMSHGPIQMWDATNGQLRVSLGFFRNEERIGLAVWSPDGHYDATPDVAATAFAFSVEGRRIPPEDKRARALRIPALLSHRMAQ